MHNKFILYCFFLLLVAGIISLQAETGRELWLPATALSTVKVDMPSGKSSPTLELAKQVLIEGWQDRENNSIKLKISRDKRLSDQGYSLSPGCITAKTHQGLLYGAYEYLRRRQIGLSLELPFSNPSYQRRLLNHWDNLDGSIERGYAGRSIFGRASSRWSRRQKTANAGEPTLQ